MIDESARSMLVSYDFLIFLITCGRKHHSATQRAELTCGCSLLTVLFVSGCSIATLQFYRS
jgi:hypothetical protein